LTQISSYNPYNTQILLHLVTCHASLSQRSRSFTCLCREVPQQQGCLLLVLSGLLWCLLAHTLVNCCNSSTDNILQNKRHGHRVLLSLLPPVCSRRMPTLVLGDPALGALRVHRRYDCGI
jgi:hypothetical protein